MTILLYFTKLNVTLLQRCTRRYKNFNYYSYSSPVPFFSIKI